MFSLFGRLLTIQRAAKLEYLKRVWWTAHTICKWQSMIVFLQNKSPPFQVLVLQNVNVEMRWGVLLLLTQSFLVFYFFQDGKRQTDPWRFFRDFPAMVTQTVTMLIMLWFMRCLTHDCFFYNMCRISLYTLLYELCDLLYQYHMQLLCLYIYHIWLHLYIYLIYIYMICPH